MVTKIDINEKIIGYLKNIPSYQFPTPFHLVLSLFSTYEKGNKDMEDIQVLLDYLGYKNLNEISPEMLSDIEEIIKINQHEWEKLSDLELCTYTLLHEIKKKNILMMIDNKIIEDLSDKITLTPNSTISFIDLKYINTLKNELK
jgi:hypothetical protein